MTREETQEIEASEKVARQRSKLLELARAERRRIEEAAKEKADAEAAEGIASANVDKEVGGVVEAVIGTSEAIPGAMDGEADVGPGYEMVEAGIGVAVSGEVVEVDSRYGDCKNWQDTQKGKVLMAGGKLLARVYCVPSNPRLRLIEFRDGSHGRLYVSLRMPGMLGWVVRVQPCTYPIGENNWELHGSYNGRGVFLSPPPATTTC